MRTPGHPAGRGTSLVEVAAAAAVLTALVLLMFQVFDAAARGWGRARRRADALRGARLAAGLMVRDLASVCRSSLSTNLAIGAAEPQGGGDRLFAIAVRPGGFGEVAAVGYRCVWRSDRHAYALVRSFLPPGRTLDRLRRGEDPFDPAAQPAAFEEEIAPCLWDLRVTAFDAEDRETGPGAFTTNLPARIEIAFRTLPPPALPAIAALKRPREVWSGPALAGALPAAGAEAIDIRTSVALP